MTPKKPIFVGINYGMLQADLALGFQDNHGALTVIVDVVEAGPLVFATYARPDSG